MVPGPFIENGYLQAVKGLCLGLGHNANFQPVYDSIDERNSVLSCTVVHQQGYWNNVARNSFGAEETKRQIIDIFTRFKKMNQLTIIVQIDTQDQAKWLWELMRVAVHTNTRPKIVNFIMTNFNRAAIDWSFINDDEKLDHGSIEELHANYAPIGFFSNLAKTDTLVAELFNSDFWLEGNRLLETKAKNLCIVCDLRPNVNLQLMDQIVTLLRADNAQKTFNVETVECCVVGDIKEALILPTFENDSSAWNKVKDWFLPMVKNYNQVLRSAVYYCCLLT